MKQKNTISIHTCKKLLQKGNNARISKEASKELSTILEEMADTITQRAKILSRHAHRKTITREDVLLAVEQLEQE